MEKRKLTLNSFLLVHFNRILIIEILISDSFSVDCSGSMTEDDGIGLARQAMLLFIRSLPLGSHFNIIRFGSRYDILFKSEGSTAIYSERTAKTAEDLTRSMEADFGGTELLEPLKYLKEHPPVQNRSRQIFLLTDGEISNTNEVRYIIVSNIHYDTSLIFR
jgi:hypothetical protein